MAILNQNNNLQIAAAMRAVRGAIGWSQVDFAKFIGVSKPTIARAETLETAISQESVEKMIISLNNIGIFVEMDSNDNMTLKIDANALLFLKEKLEDENKRRSDRVKFGLGVES